MQDEIECLLEEKNILLKENIELLELLRFAFEIIGRVPDDMYPDKIVFLKMVVRHYEK